MWLGSLADPNTLNLVVEASVAATASSLPDHFDASKRARAAELAAYTVRLRAGRVALRALARALISVGPQAALALLQPSCVSAAALPDHCGTHARESTFDPHTPHLASTPGPVGTGVAVAVDDGGTDTAMTDAGPLAGGGGGGGGGGDSSGTNNSSRIGGGRSAAGLPVLLSQLEGLLSGFVGQWSALKAHDERVAAEEAEMFKTKTRSTTIINDEVGCCCVVKGSVMSIVVYVCIHKCV